MRNVNLKEFEHGVPLTEKEVKEIKKMFEDLDNLHKEESKDKE